MARQTSVGFEGNKEEKGGLISKLQN
jgi:hypothetical protein